ncbi:ParA family protein [Neopusillimonas maritima]|uniref:Chromosome partitioning protein ParA n=1 Tax=Neopusillimonas maritima TaxID=2026239 RepID=A0A3A1YNC8_9BURK|nr:ParA family protein [Neopusillimonas maritima]RIY39783.1 chromosome partitioning protein ParA [Neopusillimonas maritima]
MKVCVIAQGKGGVGKTASAAHIAFYAHEAGQRVLVIDLDTGDLSKTLAEYQVGAIASSLFTEEGIGSLAAKQGDNSGYLAMLPADKLLANLVFVSLEKAQQNFKVNLARFADHFDLCVIDTAPGLGIAKAAALHVADAVLSPVEMEAYSIEGIKSTMVTVLNARKSNPKLSFLGILPSRVDTRSPRQKSNLDQVRQAHGALMAPLVIGLRSSIAEALAHGRPVWKLRKTSARAAGKEMRELGDYVLAKLGVNQ